MPLIAYRKCKVSAVHRCRQLKPAPLRALAQKSRRMGHWSLPHFQIVADAFSIARCSAAGSRRHDFIVIASRCAIEPPPPKPHATMHEAGRRFLCLSTPRFRFFSTEKEFHYLIPFSYVGVFDIRRTPARLTYCLARRLYVTLVSLNIRSARAFHVTAPPKIDRRITL